MSDPVSQAAGLAPVITIEDLSQAIRDLKRVKVSERTKLVKVSDDGYVIVIDGEPQKKLRASDVDPFLKTLPKIICTPTQR